MATITPTAVTTAGVAVTASAASAGGDTIATSGKATRLVITNGGGASITVTFTGVVTCSQGATHNATATVAAGATEYVQIPSQCIDPNTGNVAVAYSSATSVTVAATQ